MYKYLLIVPILLLVYWVFVNTEESNEVFNVEKQQAIHTHSDFSLNLASNEANNNMDSIETNERLVGEAGPSIENNGPSHKLIDFGSVENSNEEKPASDMTTAMYRKWQKRRIYGELSNPPNIDFKNLLKENIPPPINPHTGEKATDIEQVYDEGITGENPAYSLYLINTCYAQRVHINRFLQQEFPLRNFEDLDDSLKKEVIKTHEACHYLAILTCRVGNDLDCISAYHFMKFEPLYIHPEQKADFFAWELMAKFTHLDDKVDVYESKINPYETIIHHFDEQDEVFKLKAEKRAKMIIKNILDESWEFEDFKQEYWKGEQ